jgi:UDP-N-acetylglucosamine 2-epimerase (non-hydrolysing)
MELKNNIKIISVVGARPNFMKIAPFVKAISIFNDRPGNLAKVEHILVHTGQHYDDRMSKKFFEDLGIPDADINLGIGSGSHAEQVGQTMIAFEKVLCDQKPDWVVVVGDVNATLACSVTAKKELIKCCHIEAGLRSGDIRMPEEVNRLVTDRLSDLLLTPDLMSSKNLLDEGTNPEIVKFVGNIMIDTLEANRLIAEKLSPKQIIVDNNLKVKSVNEINDETYAVVTLHRPSNVDDETILTNLISFINDIVSKDFTVVWSIHPRTFKNLQQFGLSDKLESNPQIYLTHPIGYHEMLRLNMGAKLMLTDSGGLQEECTVLGTPCLTLRWNTERPVTLVENGGASILVGNNIDRIRSEYEQIKSQVRAPKRPELWDGQTAIRCLAEIIKASFV